MPTVNPELSLLKPFSSDNTEGYFRLFVSDDVFDLRKGDSFQFNSSEPHRFENKHSEAAEVLWVVYESNEKKEEIS